MNNWVVAPLLELFHPTWKTNCFFDFHQFLKTATVAYKKWYTCTLCFPKKWYTNVHYMFSRYGKHISSLIWFFGLPTTLHTKTTIFSPLQPSNGLMCIRHQWWPCQGQPDGWGGAAPPSDPIGKIPGINRQICCELFPLRIHDNWYIYLHLVDFYGKL